MVLIKIGPLLAISGLVFAVPLLQSQHDIVGRNEIAVSIIPPAVHSDSQVITSRHLNTPRATPAYISLVNEWRTKLGLTTLDYGDKIEANALKTCNDGKGHQLIPPTVGQVMASYKLDSIGDTEGFRHLFVGGWLCEKPDMAGMDNICATEGKGFVHSSTGNAMLLTSRTYTHIGCAAAKGYVACDLR